MYINPEKKLIFIHIPKNAGTSVVERLLEDENWKHLWVYHPEAKDKYFQKTGHVCASILKEYPIYDDFETVALARNPWSKQLSTYMFWLSQMRKIMDGSLYKEFSKKGETEKENFLNPWVEKEHPPLVTNGFRGYLEKEYTNRGTALNIGPSVNWVDENRKAKHHWFKIETEMGLAADFFGIELLERLNTTQHLDYTKYYDESMIEIVRERNEKDIKKFNYKFGQ